MLLRYKETTDFKKGLLIGASTGAAIGSIATCLFSLSYTGPIEAGVTTFTEVFGGVAFTVLVVGVIGGRKINFNNTIL